MLDANTIHKLSNRQKRAIYSSYGLQGLADNRLAILSHNEGKGLSYRLAKINKKSFKKLMKKRGIKPSDGKALQESFAKWSKDVNHNARGEVKARHARKNERYYITQTKGSRASGVFVSPNSLGATPGERINKGALTPRNRANEEYKVQLARDQNILVGTIGPQPGFQKEDSRHLPRRGGGTQVITDGGFTSGAIKKEEVKKMAQQNQKSKAQAFRESLKVDVSKSPANTKSQAKKNAFNNAPNKGERERVRTRDRGMER